MDFQVYNPTIATTTVVDPYDNPAGLKYVSNSSLAFYGGLYWAIMDGNTNATYEGAAAQYVWITTSPDAKTWSAPYAPFRDGTYCTSPDSGGRGAVVYVEWRGLLHLQAFHPHREVDESPV